MWDSKYLARWTDLRFFNIIFMEKLRALRVRTPSLLLTFLSQFLSQDSKLPSHTHTAPRWCKARLGKFSLQMTMVDTLQNKADNKTFLGVEKNDPTRVQLRLCSHASLPKCLPDAPMHSATFAESRGNHHLDLFESDE